MNVAPLWRTRLDCTMLALSLAAPYAVTGWLGLWFAIPPGYAAAVWPASGLALAGILIGGTRIWPGVWLGSFAVNLGITFDATHGAALLTSIVVPTSIGIGATMQALVGASLVRRYVGFPSDLSRVREIGTFLMLGGPVSCLVSATVGVMTLAVSGKIPWGSFGITWQTWWVGDTLGVLIMTPLVLSWLAEPRAIWRRRISAALPLVSALALAFIVFGYTRAQEWDRLRLLFEREAESLAHTIQGRLDNYMDVLHAVQSFYTSAPEVSREAFRTFVRRSLARHPGPQVLSLNLRVPHVGREAYEQAVMQEGFPNFQIMEETAQGELVQAARRPDYVVVTYIEPYEGNERMLGFDVMSAPNRLDALQQARDTGQLAATGQITLVEEPDRQIGLMVFLPVYGQGMPYATVEDRRQSLQGYVTGVFRIGDMVQASLKGLEREDILLRVEDETAPTDQRLLYDSRASAPKGLDLALDKAFVAHSPGMQWKMTMDLAGRRWGLRFAATPEFLAARESSQPQAVLGSGLVFTSMLGVFLLIVTGRATIIEELMVERTAQLEGSKRLEASTERRRREAEVLAELVRTVNAALEVGTVLQRVADGARELLRQRWGGDRSTRAWVRQRGYSLLGWDPLPCIPWCPNRVGQGD